ncbi:MAG: MBL fold metallo-hydrolase [Flavobacteriales bacterium]|nr:MBL fold metallo-hydrolase [Flavobacteriales bacterium]
MTLYIIISVIVIIAVTGFLFVKLSPEFGGSHSESDKARYAESGHYEENTFQNLIETKMDMDFKNMMKTIYEFISGEPNRSPKNPLPMIERSSREIDGYNGPARLMWYGHSAFLFQMDGKSFLLDPMFGQVAAPHPWLGSNRYNRILPIEIDSLPKIDGVFISHDHYDHLDYGSIKKLLNKTDHFYLPLGVGVHFREWGVEKSRITEFNWWDEGIISDDILIAFAPTRHFSGRGLSDRNATMWGSWIIRGKDAKLYFSGDSGYGPHFKAIGKKYGPFDFALMECGQYNEKWAAIHMMPEETAQASADVKAEKMMPIHWGAFTLSLHDWNDPVKRVIPAAEILGIPVIVPKMGEFVSIESPSTAFEDWWKSII